MGLARLSLPGRSGPACGPVSLSALGVGEEGRTLKDRLSRETPEELGFIPRELLLTSEVQRQESEKRGDKVIP